MKPTRPNSRHSRQSPTPAQHGLARVISKRGICSRSQAEALVREGRVRVAGHLVRDPEASTLADAEIAIDGVVAESTQRRYLMLNKPRGMVTTASDESGRATVYACLQGEGLPWLAPVGRLDKASEGLLLLSNDSEWAARITSSAMRLDKTYHVQIDRLVDADLIARLRSGIEDRGEHLAVVAVRELRRGEKNSWLEVVLDEGRNRQIRRLLSAFDISVLRLVRVAIGALPLGELGKGQWRELVEDEVRALASPSV